MLYNYTVFLNHDDFEEVFYGRKKFLITDRKEVPAKVDHHILIKEFTSKRWVHILVIHVQPYSKDSPMIPEHLCIFSFVRVRHDET